MKSTENHNYICQLIQKDLIDDFIVYVNENNFLLSAKIEKSIFETNNLLLSLKYVSLLDYSAFFGSLQIFKYLIMNKEKITNSVLLFAIHGRNPEIIQLIEDHLKNCPPKIYEDCMNEAIKCHHNEIAQYLENNFLEDRKFLIKSVAFFNFEFITKELMENPINFFYACKYDNPFIVKYIVNNFENLNINAIFKTDFCEQTCLSAAIEEENREIVKILLSIPDIDINIKSLSRLLNIGNEDVEVEDDKDQRSH